MNGGDLVGAEESCRRSIQVGRSLGPASRALVGQALHNMGVVARLRGEFDRAVGLFGQSIEIYGQIDPGGTMVAANHWDIAATEAARRDVSRLDEAEAHLRLSDQIYGSDARHAALAALVRADIAYQRSDFPAAELQLRQALPYFDRLTPDGMITADIIGYQGIVLTEQGKLTEAEELLRRALANSRRFAPASQKTAEFNHHLGILLWRAGRLAEAEVALQQALNDLEYQLGRFAGSDEESSSFSAQYADFYKAYLDLLLERRREQDAFLILERYRAGSFLKPSPNGSWPCRRRSARAGSRTPSDERGVRSDAGRDSAAQSQDRRRKDRRWARPAGGIASETVGDRRSHQEGVAEVRGAPIPAAPGPGGNPGGARTRHPPAVLLRRQGEEFSLRRFFGPEARAVAFHLCAFPDREGAP
jgi:tetratricopeptide (TPR) repeat protein